MANKYLSVFTLSSVRISAAFNPILGIVFGWPAIIACAVGNFVSDIASGWGLSTAIIGLPGQLIYGFVPYVLWRKFIRARSHVTRLDSSKKVALFFAIIALDCVIIAINVALMQYFMLGIDLLTTFKFVFLNDLSSCVIFGFTFFAINDLIYSKWIHKGRRTLSFNEIIILCSSAVIFISLFVISIVCHIVYKDYSVIDIWTMIFLIYSIVIAVSSVISFVIMWIYSIIKNKNAKLRIIEKPNGTIFADEKKLLEFVSFPGQKLDNRIKADALGYTLENAQTKIVPNYETAWYTQLSSQKGCPMKCDFCDCPAYGYYGNVSLDEFDYQINTILDGTGSKQTDYFEVDFTRMGEPTFNKDLLTFIEYNLRDLILDKVDAKRIVPFISTMLPKANLDTYKWLSEYCRIKNEVYNGDAELQFSVSSTDDKTRNALLNNRSLSLAEIAKIGNSLPMPKGNKYYLNFPLTKDSKVKAKVIANLFDKNKFAIKLTPIHKTFNAIDNGFKITSEYDDYSVFEPIEKDFQSYGFDVVSYLDKKEEDEDALTCGHLLLPNISDKINQSLGPKKRVGLVVAIEMDAIFEMYPNHKELESDAGFKVYLVERDGYSIFIVQSGMGECLASSAVQYLISTYKVSKVINFGVVGGLTQDMSKLKVSLVDKVVHYKYDCSEFLSLPIGQVVGYNSIFMKTNENLVKKALSLNSDLVTATCCSGDKFISKSEEKAYLHNTFGGDICDMESAGILITCDNNKVPCILFKAVSDGLTDGADGFFKELYNASIKCLKIVDKMLDEMADFE
ncbi:MAG: hypothetical protein MJ236_04475 [Clostridia bacterium]|nr:hypothetical protein [Clostridia bacterium]